MRDWLDSRLRGNDERGAGMTRGAGLMRGCGGGGRRAVRRGGAMPSPPAPPPPAPPLAARGSPPPPPPARGGRSRHWPASARSFAPLAAALSRSRASRARSAARSISPASGSDHRRFVQTPPAPTPCGTSPSSGRDLGRAGQPADRLASSARRAPASPAPRRAAAPAPACDGGTFISARTARTSEISRTTQSSSARAASASGTGDGSRPGRADQAARRAVAEAVPQLLGDERHRRVQQAQDDAQHMRAVARTSAAPRRVGASASTGLANSRNQSQKVFQTKR